MPRMAQASEPPPPRSGFLGFWDRFVGPGTTPAENNLTLLSGLLGTAFALWLLLDQRASGLQLVLAGLLAFDIFGGVVANATRAAKRWYHRPGVRPYDQLGFVALHLVHLGLVAWSFRAGDWLFFGIFALVLLLSTLLILRAPPYLKRPLALALYMASLLLSLYAFGPTLGLEWFIPLLFLKLLVSHLIPEKTF